MNFLKAHASLLALTLAILGSVIPQCAFADDTEIFFSKTKSSVNPNVMFIIDVSGSMDQPVKGSEGATRLTSMQKALKTVLKSAPENLNVGLMNYGEVQGRDLGHGVKFPTTDISALAEPIASDKLVTHDWGKEWWNSSIPDPGPSMTVRDYLSRITDWYWKDNWYLVDKNGGAAKDMNHVGTTPIVEALYEAALYFRGEKVSFGLGDAGYWNRWAAHQSTYEGDPIRWDSEKCENSWRSTFNKPIDFENDEYPWYRCPADVNNPTSPGSYANCKLTENCRKVTKRKCKNYISGYCSDYATDEGGNRYCKENSWVSGYCKNGEYHNVVRTRCTYDRCSGGHTSEPNYKTPITQACQSNFIVLLSDGKPQYSQRFDGLGNRDGTNSPGPTYNNLKNGAFSPMVDKIDSSNQFDHTDCDRNQTPSGYRSGTCGPELTRFLADADNSDLEGVQAIDTYAIGFGLDGEASATEYLQSLVSTDDPSTPKVEGYFSAEDEVQLSQAFGDILQKISSTTTSFASPAYSVDLKTGMFNEDAVYIPVFDKKLTPRWSGNLKKFKLRSDSDGNNLIVDKNGNSAVDDLGVFTDDATDFWSTSSGDGREVGKGGVSQLIDPNNRNAITDIACSSYPCSLMDSTRNSIHSDNDVSKSGEINNAVMGLEEDVSDELRISMIDFIRGRQLNKETGVFDLSPHMGDMLHTEPVVVTYLQDYESDPSKNGQVIFAATNEGYLHAFNTVTGKEIFAFMPSSLMKNIPVQFHDAGVGKHAYGIDGIISKSKISSREVSRNIFHRLLIDHKAGQWLIVDHDILRDKISASTGITDRKCNRISPRRTVSVGAILVSTCCCPLIKIP